MNILLSYDDCVELNLSENQKNLMLLSVERWGESITVNSRDIDELWFTQVYAFVIESIVRWRFITMIVRNGNIVELSRTQKNSLSLGAEYELLQWVFVWIIVFLLNSVFLRFVTVLCS